MKSEVAAIGQNPDENQHIPRKIRHACDLLISGEARTIKSAAEKANVSREHLGRMLKRSHIQAYVTRECRQTLAIASMQAVAILQQMLEGAQSEHVKKDIVFKLLEIAGLAEKGGIVQVNVGVTPGYVIDLSGGTILGSTVQDSASDE